MAASVQVEFFLQAPALRPGQVVGCVANPVIDRFIVLIEVKLADKMIVIVILDEIFLGLLDNPTSGTYYLDGGEVGKLKESQRTKVRKGQIGFVFQSFNLIDELNVEENVELPLTYLGVPKKERKVRVEEVLRRMAISHRAHHFPQQLSGGQQQRVAIARAVVMNPKLILADEPTGNLDSKNGLEVMQLLTELNRDQGATIVMVTHSERDAGYAQRIISLFDGLVVPEVSL